MAGRANQDWNALPLRALFDELAREDARIAIGRALDEDLGRRGDITSSVSIERGRPGSATFVSRSDGVLAGLRVVEMIASQAALDLVAHADDGDRLVRGGPIATVRGPYAAILSNERTMLNFLTLLSGNATMAARFVDAIGGTGASICDTRKTIPGLRTLQKYATRCGGALLHRIGLFDAVLLKDNHLGAFEAGTLTARVRRASIAARVAGEISFVECEVDSLGQLDELLSLEKGVLDMILLDNMDPATLAEAVRRRNARASGVLLEASGGVTLATVRAIAESGVDRISVGAITHSAPAVDIGLDMRTEAGIVVDGRSGPGAGA
jgi:nicotinate-nucleotide pyrophosphorylase (carboxylating)